MPDLSNVPDYVPETQPIVTVKSVSQEEAIAQGFYTVTQEELNLQLPPNVINDLQTQVAELKAQIELLLKK